MCVDMLCNKMRNYMCMVFIIYMLYLMQMVTRNRMYNVNRCLVGDS